MNAGLAVRTGLIGVPEANGLRLPPDLTLDELAGALRTADALVDASPWFLVDLMTYGEDRFREDFSQILPTAEEDPKGASQARMKQAAWMGRVYPRGTRVLGMTYSHHRAVADLPPAERTALLEQAVASPEPVSTREIRKRADERKRAIEGRAVDVRTGEALGGDDLPWTPGPGDLEDHARRAIEARAPQGRLRSAFIAGAVFALHWSRQEALFTTWPEADRD